MRIGIIGGGSIGLLFACYLSKIHQVTLYTKSQKQADEINIHGVSLEKELDRFHARMEATPYFNWTGEEHLTLIAVKQYQLQDLMPIIMEKSSANKNHFLFLQNGMGHLKWLNDLRAASIIVGSVEHGAAKINAHTVDHNGMGVTRAAVYRGGDKLLNELADSLSSSFPIEVETDYRSMLIKKLVVNAVINPLTSILKVKNGQLIENPYYYSEVISLFNEVADILNLERKQDHLENLISICRNTANNRSSMLKDLEEGRPTEADAILGYLADEANRENKNAPLIQLFLNCIRGKELEKERF
ncbi:2-dehydropantoate 2-reductase [Mesobacillus harenae]|uniref:2-dehydropantoate 2-reductase n=1 Tax=Mesobacillus harenae TaxID=2213203 RepID=UPI0015804E98|nr:2-dehydropantoate 2-reductase [Mesobacillus harenae]